MAPQRRHEAQAPASRRLLPKWKRPCKDSKDPGRKASPQMSDLQFACSHPALVYLNMSNISDGIAASSALSLTE
ncbi:hypothetical protein GN956_G15717 [Arapaima gigas]